MGDPKLCNKTKGVKQFIISKQFQLSTVGTGNIFLTQRHNKTEYSIQKPYNILHSNRQEKSRCKNIMYGLEIKDQTDFFLEMTGERVTLTLDGDKIREIVEMEQALCKILFMQFHAFSALFETIFE